MERLVNVNIFIISSSNYFLSFQVFYIYYFDCYFVNVIFIVEVRKLTFREVGDLLRLKGQYMEGLKFKFKIDYKVQVFFIIVLGKIFGIQYIGWFFIQVLIKFSFVYYLKLESGGFFGVFIYRIGLFVNVGGG